MAPHGVGISYFYSGNNQNIVRFDESKTKRIEKERKLKVKVMRWNEGDICKVN